MSLSCNKLVIYAQIVANKSYLMRFSCLFQQVGPFPRLSYIVMEVILFQGERQQSLNHWTWNTRTILNSRVPTLNSDPNCATLKVPYIEKKRSPKAKLTKSILRGMAHKVIQEPSRFM